MVLFTRSEKIHRPLGRNKILLSATSGILFLIVPVLFIFIDPIQLIVKYKLRVSKGSLLEHAMQQETPGAHLYIYLFNITNAVTFMAGEDQKLKVEEVGPFVYLEYLWFENLTFSEDGKTMTMKPKIRSEFVPELSIAHVKDVDLTLPNLPFLSSATLFSDYPYWIRLGYNQFISNLGAKSLKVINVHDYIWGYEDPLMTWCNRLLPGKIYFKTMGLLERLYDRESEYIVEVGTTGADKFKLRSVKKYRHLDMGGYEHIDVSEQVFNDTYQGFAFSPNLIPEVPINIYRVAICKTFELEYSHSQTMDYGGEAFVYEISNQSFHPVPEPGDKPLPDGLLDISTCFYNLPFGVSKAHFLDADPELLNRVDGLKPDRNVHVNQVTIDQKVAITVNTTLSLQLSMIMGDVSFNSEAAKFSNSVVPIVYIQLKQVQMTENTMSKFVLVFKIAPYVMMILEATEILIGLTLLAYAIRAIYHHKLSRKRMEFETDADKKNVVAPLLDGKKDPR